MRLTDLFRYETGNLAALELTEEGNIPLVYGTTRNNGIIKLVKVEENTKIFSPPLITVSYLGTAFVQVVPFTTSVVDKSNITILIPKSNMSIDELYFYAYQINKIAKFGFNYGRRMNQKQLNKLDLIPYNGIPLKSDLKKLLPNNAKKVITQSELEFKLVNLTSFFKIEKGKGNYRECFDSGKTPLVSATSFNNGILDYVDAEPFYKAGSITVERIKGNAFVQLDNYLTVPDDISILVPKDNMSIELLYYFAYSITRESWKYSYGRKLSQTRLKSVQIYVPFINGKVNEKAIKNIVEGILGWTYIENILKK